MQLAEIIEPSIPFGQVYNNLKYDHAMQLDEEVRFLFKYLFLPQALFVNPKDGFQLSWPMKRGRLNIHDKAGGSLTAVLADLEAIWSAVIYSQLQIPTKDLKVLGHFRELVHMIWP